MTNMSNNARSTDVRVRRNTRKNIRKHRLALYQYLDNINDTFFKEQIKLNSSDLGKLSLSSTDHQQNHELEDCKEVVNTSKQNPRLGEVKEESIELCSENSDEFLSVESNEEWYGSYSTSDDIDGDSKSELDKQNISRWNDDNKNAYVHDVDLIIINHLKDVEIRTDQNSSSELPPHETSMSKKEPLDAPPRFRAPIDRDLHNAKERQCRERIRRMFMDLAIHCSHLNNNRRIPSKHSILVAAKRECDTVKSLESKLLLEKAVWIQANKMLKDKLRNVRFSTL